MSQHLLPRFQNADPKRILALDGGGIRGALTLGILKQIETRLQAIHHNNQLRLSDYYDLIGGTSTGSIIAAALAMGRSVDEIQELYQSLGGEIFGAKRNWFGRLKATFSEGRLEKKLEEMFKNETLSSHKLKSGLCIITARADTGSTWPLINHPGGEFYKQNAGILLRKAIRASTAAPSYFLPTEMNVGGDETGAFVDGGISTHNNPALLLFLTATLKGFPFKWATGEDKILITSVGTGTFRKRRTPAEVTNSKLWDWGKEVPQLFMTDADKMVRTMMQYLGTPLNRERIDGEIKNMEADRLHGQSAFSYVRYDVSLEENTLNQLGFPGRDLESLRKMEESKNREDLKEIGLAAGQKWVQDGHFPEVFKLQN